MDAPRGRPINVDRRCVCVCVPFCVCVSAPKYVCVCVSAPRNSYIPYGTGPRETEHASSTADCTRIHCSAVLAGRKHRHPHTWQTHRAEHRPPGPVILTQGPDPGRSTPKTATCKARPTSQAAATPVSPPTQVPGPERAGQPHRETPYTPSTPDPRGHIGHSINMGQCRGRV